MDTAQTSPKADIRRRALSKRTEDIYKQTYEYYYTCLRKIPDSDEEPTVHVADYCYKIRESVRNFACLSISLVTKLTRLNETQGFVFAGIEPLEEAISNRMAVGDLGGSSEYTLIEFRDILSDTLGFMQTAFAALSEGR